MTDSKERFIVVTDVLTDDAKIIILSDYMFWSEHYDELNQWCQETNSAAVGITVTVPDAPTLTAFCLRWS